MATRLLRSEVDPSEHLAPGPGRAWWIAGAYAVVGTAWILFSDTALELLAVDRDVLVRYGTVKGLAFVLVTATLLLLLLRRSFDRIARSYERLESHQLELQRISRLYEALTHINQGIVRRPSREQLFAQTCRALVEQGGFDMAWLGQHDRAEQRVVPVASHGRAVGYLDDVDVYTDDRPEGRGPSGIALRTGRPYVCNDTFGDPAMAPWREQVRRHGLASVGSFPFAIQGDIWGALNVYAEEPHYFRDEEVTLLVEAAADVAYALENIAIEEERERAEEVARLERLFSDNMIDSMPGVVYLYDLEGKFLRWNKNFEAVSGYSADEVMAMHPSDFFPEDEQPRLLEAISKVFERGESTIQATFLHRDGSSAPYFFTGRRVDLGSGPCLVGVGIDVTDRVRAEESLRELNETLELQVERRTNELQVALERAESADRLKSAFLATMSHELRTPLNSIIGFTGIVLQELAGPLNEEQSKQLTMVRSSARHLLALINDVLDISKIEAGQLEVLREPFDLDDSIVSVLNTVSPLAAAKELELTTSPFEPVGQVTGDQRRTEQILLNLLSNAIKFTEHGQVTLCVEADEQWVAMSVSDSGIGIHADDLQQLFQPFRQIDTGLTRKHDGTGLGLAICRRLAVLMGGSITAESTPGDGSTFTVRLPRDPRGR